MENNSTPANNQGRKKKITHIRIPVSTKRRLDKIKRETGKMLDTVNDEIITLGINAYNERKKEIEHV